MGIVSNDTNDSFKISVQNDGNITFDSNQSDYVH